MRAEVVIAVVFLASVLVPSAADAAGPHRGSGIVTAFAGDSLTMQEGRGFHTIRVTPRTKVTIGAEAGISRIGVGDYIAEECVRNARGELEARRLILYRPAWKELASPEN